MTRSVAKWNEVGSEGAAADIRRNVKPGQSDAEVRSALAYHHCDDLDDAEITGSTLEERTAAIDALTAGYLDTYRQHAAAHA